MWEAAQQLAIDVHRAATGMRGVGSATLRDQLVRASMSVPANIVEGCAQKSPREVVRFLRYALSSVSEAEGHAQLARDLLMIEQDDFECIGKGVVAVRKMLYGFIKKL